MVGVVVLSWLQVVATADWLRDANVLVSAAICGVLYGLLLSSSRFRGRTALIIDLITSLGFALLVVGRVLPEMKLLTAQPFEKTMWLMNARTFTLLEALRDDAQWLLTNYFPSTRLFLFLNIFAMWNAAAWLMWCVVRRRRALRWCIAHCGAHRLSHQPWKRRAVGAAVVHRGQCAVGGAHGIHLHHPRLGSTPRRLS